MGSGLRKRLLSILAILTVLMSTIPLPPAAVAAASTGCDHYNIGTKQDEINLQEGQQIVANGGGYQYYDADGGSKTSQEGAIV